MLSEIQKRKLTKLFSMYDVDCNGFLLLKDFENRAKKLAALRGWGSRSPKYVQLINQFTYNWKCLSGDSDTNRDHKISLQEWLQHYDTLLSDPKRYTEQVRSLMELVFEVFDENGDGVISQAEWAGLLSVFNVSPIYASDVFTKLDSNQDGSLSREEVLQLIQDFFHSDQLDAPANFMFGPY